MVNQQESKVSEYLLIESLWNLTMRQISQLFPIKRTSYSGSFDSTSAILTFLRPFRNLGFFISQQDQGFSFSGLLDFFGFFIRYLSLKRKNPARLNIEIFFDWYSYWLAN